MENTNTLVYLLKDRFSFIDEIHNSEKLNSKIISLLFTSFICFAIYGAIIGATNSAMPIQILSSAVKLPALYLVTLIVCLPTLYIFNAFFGSRSTIQQHWAYLLSAITVISVLLCGFAPITLFFLLTVNDKFFFLLLNVAIFALTGILGVSFLYRTMKPTEADEQAGNIKIRKNILKFWLGLYGFVGTQLGWTLRPFFGTGSTFEVFRPREGSFFTAVWESFHQLGL
ncbi:hypothetical protein [Chamaesiphon sp. VAR_48_metabat_403]|uniref:hypothetical protein n=1 Tax=Chamaesiphon sp. VAR_48_metabat_403 TaxID=2964700 RepID=UPI00286E98AF|nr:hypothetical protein [Chamaesiphon sp. VAR_48_metabat_403]